MANFEDQLGRYAHRLVGYSMAGQFVDGLKGKTVHLFGERNPEKDHLVELVVREVEQAGGAILDRMFDPRERAALLHEAVIAQDPSTVIAAAHTEGVLLELLGTAYLNIKGAEDPGIYQKFNNVDIGSMDSVFWKTLGPYLQRMMRSRPWTVALYPTEAGALENGFSDIDDYKRAVLSPCIDVDYQEMGRQYADLKALLDDADHIEIVTHQFGGPGKAILSIGIEHRVAVFDDGRHNMPGGEMFVTPVTNAVQGSVFTRVPFIYRDATINGIVLKFGQDGTVATYDAVKDKGKKLGEIVRVYDGGKPTNKNHGIGEVSLGLHQGIDPRMKNSLYAEKRGGVLVLALGSGYEESIPELMNEPNLVRRDALREALKGQGVFPEANSHFDIPIFDFSKPGNGCEVYVSGKGYRTQVVWDKDTNIWKTIRST